MINSEKKPINQYILFFQQPIFPYIFSILPIIDFASRNYPIVDWIFSMRLLVIILISCFLMMRIIQSVVKNDDLASIIVTVLVIFIFYSGNIEELFNRVSMIISSISIKVIGLIFALSVVMLLSRLGKWQKQNIKLITKYLAVLSVVWFSVSFIPFSVKIIKATTARNHFSPQNGYSEVRLVKNQKIDIYYIILDSYAGEDILSSLYGYDNDWFYSELVNRGFYLAKNSRSNYSRTPLSLLSSLNFNYVTQYHNSVFSDAYVEMIESLNQNSTMRLLHNIGYQTIYIQSGINSINIQNVNYRYGESDFSKFPNDFEKMYIDTTLLGYITRLPILEKLIQGPRAVLFSDYAKSIETQFSNIQMGHDDTPKFVFVHLLSPHPPFVFDTDGFVPDNQYPFGASDGKKYLGTLEEYRVKYIKQLIYINKQLLKTIDNLLTDNPNPPIIIIQGDHGPRSTVLLRTTEPRCFSEGMSILNAYYFPDREYGALYPSISPVNSFRVIFNKYFSTNLNYLPDRSYYSTDINVIDVSKEVYLSCSDE